MREAGTAESAFQGMGPQPAPACTLGRSAAPAWLPSPLPWGQLMAAPNLLQHIQESPKGSFQAQESKHDLIQLYVGRVNSRAGPCTPVMLQVLFSG